MHLESLDEVLPAVESEVLHECLGPGKLPFDELANDTDPLDLCLDLALPNDLRYPCEVAHTGVCGWY